MHREELWPSDMAVYVLHTVAGFLPGIFSGGVSFFANFYSYANFSIVFGPNL